MFTAVQTDGALDGRQSYVRLCVCRHYIWEAAASGRYARSGLMMRMIKASIGASSAAQNISPWYDFLREHSFTQKRIALTYQIHSSARSLTLGPGSRNLTHLSQLLVDTIHRRQRVLLKK